MSKPVVPSLTPWRLHGRARCWLRQLHLWTGLSVGVMYALIALSGTPLAFQKPWLQLAYPQLSGHALPDAAQRAMVLTRVAKDWQTQGLRAADFPIRGLPVWQLYFSDGTRRYLDPANGALLLTRAAGGDTLQVLREFHTHLLGGERGAGVLGVIGWLALLLLATGPLLWWPGHRQLAASLRLHTQPPTRRWLSWHRSAGVLSVPVLLLVSLTGTLMVYNAGTSRMLRAVFSEPPAAQSPAPITPRDTPIDWRAVLDAAQRALPNAALHRIALPTTTNALVNIRAQARGEWHPVGRSMISVDPYSATVRGSNDVTRNGIGVRLSNAIYPLHSGDVGGWSWRAAVALCGLLPPFFLITGFLAWRARKRRRY